MSSRIAVFNEGVVQQYASPDDLYERPANAFVASFIGENNLIPATLSGGGGTDTVSAALQCGTPLQARNGDCGANDTHCIISVRPEKLSIKTDDSAYENQTSAKFITRHYVGDFIRYYFQ